MADRPSSTAPEPCNGSSRCGCSSSSSHVSRRDFLAGAAASAGAAFVAGPFTPRDLQGPDHFVPADKKLSADWLRALTARGEPTWYSGDDLGTIGMPIGGICAGQLYLTGDGRLVNWDVFNSNANSGYGRINYEDGRTPTERVEGASRFVEALPVDQGFAVRIRRGDRTLVRTLDARGFAKVRFLGEYPIATVEFTDDEVPLRVTLEAFSPFVPLDTDDSALPATVMRYALENTSDDTLDVTLAGWLENVVGRRSAEELLVGRISRRNQVVRQDRLTAVVERARYSELELPEPAGPPEVFADFEGGDYGDWKVEGEAFGAAPATGTLPRQQDVSGFQGKGLVNTFLGGDDPHGRLVSPTFEIERPFLSFLIGGGSKDGDTCMNLVVDGEIVRTATGKNNEALRPRDWDVRDLIGKRAHLEIVDRASGSWGHVNVDQIEFRDRPMAAEAADARVQRDWGSMCLATVGDGESYGAAALPSDATQTALLDADGALWLGTGDDPVVSGPTVPLRGAVGERVRLAPGERRVVTFVVAWNFPNLWFRDRHVGNRYRERFPDALAVARHVAQNLDRLAAHTRLWHETFYDSTLPRWLLDRTHSTIANLATVTCQWWRDGRFWAWEGTGCCHGTCGHVWNYAHGLARLFPELERSAREMQDFADGVGFDAETGAIMFRGEGWNLWAGDSQAGYVLKAFREHQCSADAAFLERNWPHVKKAMTFLIERDADNAEDPDGLIESRQHNTYDIDYFGANTMVGSLYLAALRAAEEMAREVGDNAFAKRCRAIYEDGRRLTVERLFDGEYFVQKVDLEAHPEWQYGDGCLADQLFGQSWAHQVGLGHVYPEETVRTALASIWKYCWAPDVGPQNEAHAPERWFARPGEAGLFTCTWPKSRHMGPRSTRYRDEIWTGIEYQVASNMAWDGMVTEALAICRGVHERYHPSKHNPWNEIECGDHYARALASWGVLLGLCGFEYHGPAGRIGFAPRITPEDFRCGFTAAEGWGSLAQRRTATAQENTIEVRWGRLRLAELAFELPAGRRMGDVAVEIAGASVSPRSEQDGRRVRVTLPRAATVDAGDSVRVRIALSS